MAVLQSYISKPLGLCSTCVMYCHRDFYLCSNLEDIERHDCKAGLGLYPQSALRQKDHAMLIPINAAYADSNATDGSPLASFCFSSYAISLPVSKPSAFGPIWGDSRFRIWLHWEVKALHDGVMTLQIHVQRIKETTASPRQQYIYIAFRPTLTLSPLWSCP